MMITIDPLLYRILAGQLSSGKLGGREDLDVCTSEQEVVGFESRSSRL